MLLVQLVTKGMIPGLSIVKVGFKPRPEPGMSVQHPTLATMYEPYTEAECLYS